MPLFSYKASRKDGTRYEGQLDAADKFALYKEVRKEGGIILSVHEVHGSLSLLSRFPSILSGVKMAEKISFARNLAAMIEAGLSLSRSLSVLQRQTRNKRFKQVLIEIEEEIRKGSPLNAALGKHADIFSSLFVSMVKAGEESGSLAQSLKVIAIQMDRTYTLRKKIRGAMMYPSIVVAAMIGIGVLMLIYVVPTLSATFKELNVELPTSTKLILFTSEFLINNVLISAVGLLILIGLVYAGFRTEAGKRALHLVIIRVPIIGGIVREVNAARTARTLSSLLSAGVSALQSIAITKDVLQNVHYKAVLAEASTLVEKGFPLSEAFTRHERVYPVLLSEMISVGEETGQLSAMLLRVAEFYESEVEQKTKDLSTVIEPLLMVVIGAGVGFFAMAMISPIYSISSGI